ncbi:hypothetical protein QOT17_016789 [Balamuthia mandrillaris]
MKESITLRSWLSCIPTTGSLQQQSSLECILTLMLETCCILITQSIKRDGKTVRTFASKRPITLPSFSSTKTRK